MSKNSLSPIQRNRKVCMCLYNAFTHDSRVLKEALSLHEAGYSITVIAVLRKGTPPLEYKNGVMVRRLPVDTLYLSRIRKSVHLPRQYFRKTKGSLRRAIESLPKIGVIRLLRRRGLTILKKADQIAPPRIESGKTLAGKRNFLRKLQRTLTILKFNYRIANLAKDERYDVFHAHDLNTLIGAYIAARQQSAKLIYDSHELFLERNRFEPYRRIGKWVRKVVEGYLINRSDRVITVNDSLAEILADKYAIRRPTVVMNTPSFRGDLPNPEPPSLRQIIGIDDRYHILLYSGAITFNRGLENLVRSLEHLSECFLVLMGYGLDRYKERLRAIAAEKGVDSRITFFGPVPSDQVTDYAASADLGVAPIENACLSYYYCSPNKLFEYLHAGLPVIASGFPELSRIIDEYGVGDTFDPSVPEDIARAAREILENPERWDRARDRTRALTSVYNWEKESRKLIETYRSLA